MKLVFAALFAVLLSGPVPAADPTPEQSAAERKLMMAEQDQVAKDIKVSPEMVKLIMAEAGNGS